MFARLLRRLVRNSVRPWEAKQLVLSGPRGDLSRAVLSASSRAWVPPNRPPRRNVGGVRGQQQPQVPAHEVREGEAT